MKQVRYPIAIQLSKSLPACAGQLIHVRASIVGGDVGGDERNRTADPLLAKQVLSRLSYIPPIQFSTWMVGLPGIEPGTSRLSSVRSSRLS